MDPGLWRRFEMGLAEVGAVAEPTWRAPLTKYLELLLLWNAKMNLTAGRDPAGIVVRHFADSFAPLADLPADARTLLDVGSGGGFPGAILAIARPNIAVTLLESLHKKAAFLSTLKRELPLPNVTVEARRLEDFDRPAGFDVVISRAAIPLPGWFDAARPFRSPTGVILAMEGSEQSPLPPGATRRSYTLDGAARAILRST